MLPILVSILMVANVAVLTTHAETKEQLQVQRSVTVEAKKASQTSSKRLTELSQEKVNIESSLKEKQLETENLQKENESLKVELQAKLAAKAKAAEEAKKAAEKPVAVAQTAQKPAPTVAVSGNKASWLAASGIPQSDWTYVDSIVQRESGWNPNAVNPSSGACGLGQQLPCGKWAGAWNDPVAALVAQHGYVKERYGSYAGAVAFWNANHWY